MQMGGSKSHVFRIHLILFWFTLLTILAQGLKDIEVEIPSYIRQGEDVIFRCNYDLERDFLYAVKWYRGNEEFYRFVPKEAPPQQAFLPYGGMDLDVRFSNEHEILLRNVSLDLSGVYKCVVSAETTFQTVQKAKRVTIVGIGYEGPKLTVHEVSYHPGDTIQANCTLEKTFPVPNITWFINDREAKLYGITPSLQSSPQIGPLVRVVSSLNYTLPESFLPTSLYCRARLFDLYDESAMKKIQPIPRKYSLRTTTSTNASINTGDLKSRQKGSSVSTSNSENLARGDRDRILVWKGLKFWRILIHISIYKILG